MDTNKSTFWQKTLSKTNHLFDKIGFGKKLWDDNDIAECENALILADCGAKNTDEIINFIKKKCSRDIPLKEHLQQYIYKLLLPLEKKTNVEENSPNLNKTQIILIAGVNGAGKTTSIAKITNYFLAQNKSIVLAAADTFRAAAREQLKHWGESQKVRVIEQTSNDPAAIAFDTINSAVANQNDIALIDTAGRLPSQKNLMAELTRIHKVCGKAMAGAPHENWLILDGTSGQNAISQVAAFNCAIPLSGLIITKLDGSAKGGFLLTLAQLSPIIPVVFIGTGEKAGDLHEFSAEKYSYSLIG